MGAASVFILVRSRHAKYGRGITAVYLNYQLGIGGRFELEADSAEADSAPLRRWPSRQRYSLKTE